MVSRKLTSAEVAVRDIVALVEQAQENAYIGSGGSFALDESHPRSEKEQHELHRTLKILIERY